MQSLSRTARHPRAPARTSARPSRPCAARSRARPRARASFRAASRTLHLSPPLQARQVAPLSEGGPAVEPTPAGLQDLLLPGYYHSCPASSACVHPVASFQARTGVNCVAFLPEGGRLAFGARNGTVRVVDATWPSSNDKAPHGMQVHTESVTAMRWMRTGFYMLSGERRGHRCGGARGHARRAAGAKQSLCSCGCR